MKFRGLAIFLVVLASAFSLLPVDAQSVAHAVTIRGRITNGTSGGQVPQGLEVTIVALAETGDELGRATTASSNGSFTAELPTAERHIVLATHLGVTYSSVVEDPAQLAEVTIHETTADDSVVEVATDTTTLLEGEQGVIEALALMRVKNISDRAFVGRPSEEAGPAVLRYPVPQGAFDVNPGAGITKGVRQIPQGFTSSDPILPGEVSIGYLYRIRSSRSGWPMRRAIFYPTERLTILVDDSLRVSSGGLRYTKRVQLGEGESRKTYLQYDGREFEPGDSLEADFSYPSGKTSNFPLYVGLVIGALLLVGLAVIVPLRKSKVRREPTRPALSEREDLIERIAALDEAFESQSLPEEDYLKQRSQMKARLEEMTRNLARQ